MELEKGTHRNTILQRAYNKYGKQNFEFPVVEFVEDVTQLITRENCWINLTGCCDRKIGYNISPTAGSNLGWKMPQEQKDHLSNIKKGIPFPPLTEEAKAMKSESLIDYYKRIGGSPFKGKTLNDETKGKISNSKIGHPLNQEHKTTLSNTHRELAKKEDYKNPMQGRKHSAESIEQISETKKRSKEKREELGLPGPGTGRKASEETKAKQSKARKGKKLSPEHVAKVTAKLKGRPRSSESRVESSSCHPADRRSTRPPRARRAWVSIPHPQPAIPGPRAAAPRRSASRSPDRYP